MFSLDCLASARLCRGLRPRTRCAPHGDDSLNYSEVDKKTLKEIEGLAEKIIENKKEGIDTEEEEREIDRIVWLKPAVGVGCMI